MISTTGIRIWTPYGYVFAEDLYIGEKVISFNPARGVCEYDTVQAIDIQYMRAGGLGINSKSMRQLLTPDHPILIWNNRYKTLKRTPIKDRFMINFQTSLNNSVLNQALFEPYRRTKDIEDIRWSARMAATIANHPRAKLDIKEIVEDLGGYEAQEWLDIFFHWNRMRPATNWMACVKLTNKEVRDTIFHIAPRAGVGAKWYWRNDTYVMSITTDGSVYPNAGWFKDSIDGLVFNIVTRNGNVLVRSRGTFLVACNRQENKN